MLALVAVAAACPVCGAPGANNEWAYVAMTVVLSLLPLGFMGGVGWWIYQHVNAASVEQ